MEITTQHAEGQRVAAGVQMVKRFLLDGIALKTGHVAERHAQFAFLMKAHFADAASTLSDEASVTAGKTAQTFAFPTKQAPSGGMTVQYLCEPLSWRG
jgi:hypothetical protein